MSRNNCAVFLVLVLSLAGCKTESPGDKQAFKYATARDILLYQRLDPLYAARVKKIKARSPKADVATAWKQGAKAVLPSKKDVPFYPGLPMAASYGTQLIPGNQEQIDKSKFLTYLQTLLGDDPAQDEAQIFSPTYRAFLRARSQYEIIFNQEMVRRMQAERAANAR